MIWLQTTVPRKRSYENHFFLGSSSFTTALFYSVSTYVKNKKNTVITYVLTINKPAMLIKEEVMRLAKRTNSEMTKTYHLLLNVFDVSSAATTLEKSIRPPSNKVDLLTKY